MKIQIQEFLDQVDDFGLLRRVGYCELDSGFVLRFSGGCSAPGEPLSEYDYVSLLFSTDKGDLHLEEIGSDGPRRIFTKSKAGRNSLQSMAFVQVAAVRILDDETCMFDWCWLYGDEGECRGAFEFMFETSQAGIDFLIRNRWLLKAHSAGAHAGIDE